MGDVSNQKANKNLKILARMASIPKNLHFHMSKHTYVTQLMARGFTLIQIAKHVGTTSSVLEKNYAHLDFKTKENMANAFPSLRVNKKAD